MDNNSGFTALLFGLIGFGFIVFTSNFLFFFTFIFPIIAIGGIIFIILYIINEANPKQE